MASIYGTLNPGEESEEFTPSSPTSDVIIDPGQSVGIVVITAKATSTDRMVITSCSGAFVLATPDNTISYTVDARGITSGTVNYFMGP